MDALNLTLLGGFDVRHGSGSTVAFRTRKAKALLAYLAWPPGQPHSRDKLAHLLWGNKNDGQARSNLRNNLAILRASLPDSTADAIKGVDGNLFLDATSVNVDATTFEALIARGTPGDLEQAMNLYRGEFLEGFEISEEPYLEWTASARAQLREKASSALAKLLQYCFSSDLTEQGIQVALRMLSDDPLQEWVHGALMRLYLRQGRHGAALRQYESCRRTLARELSVAPSAEIEGLYREVRSAGRADKRPAMRNTAPSGPATARETGSLSGVTGPSVAVLPFRNVRQDPDQQIFIDGLSEDIIFALSATRSFPVLARNSTILYKDRDSDAQTIGEELGAGYVLSGSVRRSGNQFRVLVELMKVDTGVQVWSERYEHLMDDIFVVQDDITTAVVATLEPEIDEQEMRRVLVAQPFVEPTAYELAQRGFWHLAKNTHRDYRTALRQFRASSSAAPQYARAYAGMTQGKYFAGLNLWEDSQVAMKEAIRFGRTALDLDERDPRALRYFGGAQVFLGRYDEGLQALRRTIAIHPSYAMAYSGLALALVFVGEFGDAVTAEETTERLRPGDRQLHMCKMSKGMALYQMKDYETAARVCRESLALNDRYWMSNLVLAATLAQMREPREAQVFAERAGRLLPSLTQRELAKRLPFKHREHLDHIIDGLRKAKLELG